MTASATTAPAGIAVRLLAAAYEAVLVGALMMALGFLLLPWVTGHSNPAPGSGIALPGSAGRALSFACLLLGFGAYFTWLWSDGRQTLAMRTWRLQLATSAGTAVNARRAALRYAAWWIGPLFALGASVALRTAGQARWAIALLGLNYAWALIDRNRQFLHDCIAGTLLLRSAARQRSQVQARRQDI
ncbi:MAG: RDD family protein [Casimicrobiaceae bacterium]